MPIRAANAQDFVAFYGEMERAVVLVGADDSPKAIGGLVRKADGRLWMFLDVAPGVDASEGVRIVRAGRALVCSCTEAVFAPCEGRLPTAARLLGVLGFRPTDERFDGMTVWQWQV